MRDWSAADDAELLALLRDGEAAAYTELWRRHVKAAMRVAQRIAPGQAEDLVSESFLAVYRQVTTTDSGPRSAFRAYLFTVMRNTAVSWHRKHGLVDTDPDVDAVEAHDGLSELEDRTEAALMLEAFEQLPERWQRILWLAEIERRGRREIAAEFAIKPNAVSALYRRARQGLRVQWLMQRVPEDLREDQAHVARLLPASLAGGSSGGAAVAHHLADCARCSDVERELRAVAPPLGRGALSVAGFAALGVVLPTASHLSLAGAGAGAGAAGTAFGAAGTAVAVAAGVALLAGGALSTTLLLGQWSPAAEQMGDECVSADCSVPEERSPAVGTARERAEDERLSASEEAPLVLGRGNSDASIAVVGVGGDARVDDHYLPPERPTPAPPGTIPDPLPGDEGEAEAPGTGTPGTPGTPGDGGTPTPLPPGGEDSPSGGADPGSSGGGDGTAAPGEGNGSAGGEPAAILTAGLSTPRAFDGYLAPVIGGTATAGASVAVELVFRPEESWQSSWTQRFAVTPAADGRWSFDMRSLAESQYGGYDYRVWAFTEDAVSQAASGAFTVSRPLLRGFEDMAFLDLAESSTSGVVFEVRGPARGTICLTSVYSGQLAEIPLNERGEAVRRMRMLSGGAYYLAFRACAEQHRGPAAEVLFDVFDPDGPIFGPFGPDPAETVFVLEEVEEEAAPGEEAEGGNPSEPGAGETVAEPPLDTQTIP